MILANIRKWNTEFWNYDLVCLPGAGDILRRVSTNLNFFFENYIICFFAIFS
jgi:hypothetical protein